MKIYANIDLFGNQLLNYSSQLLGTAPATPFEGQEYYNTATHRKFTWNGTAWVGNDAVGATMTGADIVAAINGSASLIDDNNLSVAANTAITKAHDQAHKASHITGGADMIDAFTATASGLVPLSGGGTTKYLRADGSFQVPPDTIYTHPNHSGEVTSVGDGAQTITAKAVTLAKMADMATASFIGRNTLATGVPEILSVATVKTMLGLASGAYATAYVHPNHSGDVTSVADGATTIGANKVTNSMLAQMPTLTIKGNNTGGTANALDLTVAQVKTVLGMVLTETSNAIGFAIAGGTLASGAFATAYVHPSGDGNLHVPANGTGNSGNVLTASGVAGTYTWSTPAVAWANVANKPSSVVADIDDAVSKRHTQNTDTGTSSATFMIGTGGSKIKNSSGEIQIRNNGDTGYADLRCGNFFVEGTTFTVNSETINLADNQIVLNSDITTNAGNNDGGIAVKRFMVDNVTRKDAELFYDVSAEKWVTIFGAVANTLVTAQVANKVTSAIGNGTLTSLPVVHNLNTKECVVSIRDNASPYAGVMCDWEFTDLNTITFKFAVAPTASQFTVTIIG